MPTWSGACAIMSGITPSSLPSWSKARPKPAPSSPTTSTPPNRSPRSPRTAPSLCCAAATRNSSPLRWCWRVRLKLQIDVELMTRLRQAAETEAVRVFAGNLKDVLMAAPAGGRATIGLDPGLRTGVKVAVIAATGKVLETLAIYPHEPKKQWDQSIAVLAALAQRHKA